METDLVNALAILQSPAFRSTVAKKQCLNRLLRRCRSVGVLRPVETRYSGNLLQTFFKVLVRAIPGQQNENGTYNEFGTSSMFVLRRRLAVGD
ncbi:hypothetical protein J6590_086933, partial [Homalodisca vitripennis]